MLLLDGSQDPVVDLRAATQACYRTALEQHLCHGSERGGLTPSPLRISLSSVRELRAKGLVWSHDRDRPRGRKQDLSLRRPSSRLARYQSRDARCCQLGAAEAVTHGIRRRGVQWGSSSRRLLRRTSRSALCSRWLRSPEPVCRSCSALRWVDVRIDDIADAEVEFSYQVDRHGNLRPTKTDCSARTVPIPPQARSILGTYRSRSDRILGTHDFVFSNEDGSLARSAQRAPCTTPRSGEGN